MTDIVIASAARTPVGAFNGGLASLAAHKLGEVAIVEALRRANVEPKDVSEVIIGQILAAGEGQNPARQAAIAAGIPFEATAYSVNQLCGSGLRTVATGCGTPSMAITWAILPRMWPSAGRSRASSRTILPPHHKLRPKRRKKPAG